MNYAQSGFEKPAIYLRKAKPNLMRLGLNVCSDFHALLQNGPLSLQANSFLMYLVIFGFSMFC